MRLVLFRRALAHVALLAVALTPVAGADSAPVYTLAPSRLEVPAGEPVVFEIRRDSGEGPGGVIWRVRSVGGDPSAAGDLFEPRKITFAPGEKARRISLALDQPDELEWLEIVLRRPASPGIVGSPGILKVELTGPGHPAASANRPPTIAGTPAPVAEVGRPWLFRPTVSDPDGDALTFTLGHGPGWAEFDAGTGVLAGTPAAGDRGLHDNIVLAVTDGVNTVSIPAFSVEVRDLPEGDGTATLSWTPPTRRVDGTPLDNLAGFRIYVGSDPTQLERVRQIRNPGVTRYLVEGLSAGEWAFAITAFDADGRESAYGNILTKVIR